MTGYEFARGPWQDVGYLIEETDKFYASKVLPKGGPDKYRLAREKIVPLRGWEPSLPLIEPAFDRVLRELGVFYVPKQLLPGPAIVFPRVDLERRPVWATVKPLYELKFKDEVAKYAALGPKGAAKGPRWLGNTVPTMERALETGAAILVEGPFDVLAARLVAPAAPVLSTATKGVNDQHIAYLKIFGVKRLTLLFDHEEPKEGKREGAGDMAAAWVKRKYEGPGFEVDIIQTPVDPSDCLRRASLARKLGNLLEAAI